MVDSRKFVSVDKRFPVSMAGDAGKQLTVSDDETVYQHQSPSGVPVGSLIFYMFDNLPVGYIPTNATYNYDDYPELGALFGAVTGETFTVPEILFIKNSNGVNTGTVEPESVGTHGHDADPLDTHDHACSARAVGNHRHKKKSLSLVGVQRGDGSYKTLVEGQSSSFDEYNDYGGAHTPIIDLSPASAGTPVINDHTGTNQPECTLVNIGIKF